MSISRARRARHARGTSSVQVALVLAVALSSAALGAFGDRIVERAREVLDTGDLVAPASPSLLAVAPTEPQSFPREAKALRAALKRPASPAVLAELVGRLGLMGDSSDVRRLEPFLADRSPLVRHAALDAMARVGDDDALERVAAFARGSASDPDVHPAIQALARSSSPLAEETLLALVDGAEQWRRDAALGALSVRGGAKARQVLHRELLSGPVGQSWSAAHNVARLGEAADARLLMRLAAGTGQRSDAALSSLSSLPGDDVDGFLITLASTATGNRKGQLLGALGQVRDPAALDVLDEVFDGPARWHGYAWQALGASQAPGALELLLDRVPDARTSQASELCNALGARSEEEARLTLRSLARGDDAFAAAALGSLASLEDSKVTDLLLSRYDEEGRLPPPESLMHLATRGGDEGWELLEEVLAEGSQSDRGSVVWALQQRGDEDARDRLLALARGGDPMLAPQALGALENMDEDARDALRGLLVERVEGGEVHDWGQSMQTLARLGGEDARRILTTRVEEGTAQERANALGALAQMDDPQAQATLAGVFEETDDPALRSQALSYMLWSPDGIDPDLLDEALADDDPMVVSQVISALPQSGGEDVKERLLAFADADDASVRGAALGALAQTGGLEAEAALVSALDDPDVASQAVWNLQSLGTQGARDALRGAARSDDPTVRSQAIGALGMDPSAEADELLREGLDAADESVVLAAVGAMQSRGNSSAAEALAELLTNVADDDESVVRTQVAWALQAIGGRVAEEHADLIAEVQGGPMGEDGLGLESFELHLGHEGSWISP
ncbi:MAG: HEAT repeat domain-containing protein [Deltaproteobacteria bacterium]|nr:HEAT repeat domain-containing protein [Deltaproteobacteria bacterium]